ncbi:phosphoglycerate mutase-like protein [Hypoxylon crocopeplum]|nr:phosphoglycerate mutase-like protein [Hypoxylon crocopeplum]
MRLLLIRHGESIDNVAGLYAGSRNSPLTNHGVLQIKRLGAHLVKRHEILGPVKHVFTSTLQRAYQTAEAIVEAHGPSSRDALDTQTALKVCRLPELAEKDYGSFEGKKYGIKIPGTASGLVQSDVETHDSMKARINRFLDFHLTPIIDKHMSDKVTVMVVAHGIILGVLLKSLLERFPPRLSLSTPQSSSRESPAEFAAWSNTGVLQARLESNEAVSLISTAVTDAVPASSRERLPCLTIEFTNNLDHLQGLKKTRGGIGSAKFDSRQRTMDSFFNPSKKRKLEDATGS